MKQNLAQIANFCPKTISLRNFEILSKIEILVFSKKKLSICRKVTKACGYYSDFRYNFFSYAFSIVQKWPLYVKFSIPLCVK
jgi:hypothetical protein